MAGVDLLVIGGGVTGAAVFYEAARRGLRCALVERGDFACGTSSRSSKLVHGGLRYLKEGKIGLTRESVRERQALLDRAPGLIEPIAFLMAHYRGRKPSRTTLALGLALYDALAGRTPSTRGTKRHGYVDAETAALLAPAIDRAGLEGAHWYMDATTDDARLVLRLIQEGRAHGGDAQNYVAAELLANAGDVRTVRLRDLKDGSVRDVAPRAIVNATGVFADGVRAPLGAAARLRPLRGSHLVVDDAALPLAQCVAFEHPRDGRPVFAYPWQGRTLVGTTDVDHERSLDDEPAIARDEYEYLMEAIAFAFPAVALTDSSVIATYAGVRPVIGSHDGAPSKMSRDHAVWIERGVVTITGGKLTTFRPMALDALRAAAPQLPAFDLRLRPVFTLAAPPETRALEAAARRRLAGRYGSRAGEIAGSARPGELERIGATDVLWAELRWCARNESVVHLDDLLLRRTRLGLLLRNGGMQYADRIAGICRDELGWDAARSDSEADRYRALSKAHYGVPQ